MPQAFKADLLYGASGTRKTTNIGHAAEYVMRKYGKRTRLITADGGGYEPIEGLVKAGLIDVWAIRNRQFLIESIDKACQGYWPLDPDNPYSPLAAPTLVSYNALCYRCREDGKPKLIYGPKPAMPTNLICPACKAVVGPRDIDVHVVQQQTFNPENDMREVGLIGIEGLTSVGDAILENLMQKKASLSQDPAYSYIDGTTSYSGGNMSYYGFVQSRLYEFVHKSHMIPFVEKVIWTALEAKGEEEATRTPIFGPAIAGRKATGKAGAWFGNMLHFEAIQKAAPATDVKTQQIQLTTDVVIYTRSHAELISKVPFQAKTRAPYQFASEIPEYVEPDVDKLYTKLDELKGKAEALIQKIMPQPQTANRPEPAPATPAVQ